MMTVSLIGAASDNNVIGQLGQIPWKLPDDLKYFKEKTMGKPIIMGRKTFDSMGKPLPGRTNIVVTRRQDLKLEGVLITDSLESALKLAEKEKPEEIVVIGGGEIYRQALPHASRIYLTRVHTTVEGDAFFPEFSEDEWELLSEEKHEKDARNEFDYTYLTYERRPL